ncbi:hypothetical protein [Pedomonas sp. V897]|uniref:hypothetical protein n=1 Tax=Pedomonas sp. V897 TaxID=3446482 RepID=UPI003EDF826E
MGAAKPAPGQARRRRAMPVAERATLLPPCCLPGAGGAPASVLDALEARPTLLAAFAAVLMLALGPAPAQGGIMTTLCTADGARQVPLDENGPRRDDGAPGCAHACLTRDRRRG